MAGSRGFSAALAGCMLLFVTSAAMFAMQQSVWVDETTQFSGLALPLSRLFPWLLGDGPNLGVPPDRAPPLSYLLGMVWQALAGSSELAMRWFGIACSSVALMATATAARRAYGTYAAIAAALFLALAPTLTTLAPEVRAYPPFFMFSALGLYALVRAVQASAVTRAVWLTALTAAMLLASYTHYFGVVCATGVFAALWLDARREGKSMRPVLLAGAAYVVLVAGIGPFVLAALHLSAKPSAGAGFAFGEVIVRAAKLIYRLYGHPALANSLVLTALAAVGFVSLWLLGLFGGRRLDAVTAAILCVCIVGVLLAFVSAFIVHGFDTLAPHYNLWLCPFIAMLLGRGATAAGRWRRAVATVSLAMLVAGMAFAVWQIQSRPGVYAHGPQRQIFTEIDGLGSANVDIVFDDAFGDGGAHVFFPARYHYGDQLPQYHLPANATQPVRFDPNDPVPLVPARRYAMIIGAKNVSASALADRLRDPAGTPSPMRAADLLKKQGWQPVSRSEHLGLVTANIEVLRRAP